MYNGDQTHVSVQTKTLEDLGFHMSISMDGEVMGQKVCTSAAQLKSEVFQLMLATAATGNCAFDIGGDKDSSFMGEFCADVDGALDSIAIIHDLPYTVDREPNYD